FADLVPFGVAPMEGRTGGLIDGGVLHHVIDGETVRFQSPVEGAAPVADFEQEELAAVALRIQQRTDSVLGLDVREGIAAGMPEDPRAEPAELQLGEGV